MTGNRIDAADALAGLLPILSTNGSTRTVYRIGNVVYKVNQYFEANYDANVEEYRNIAAINANGNLPDGVYVPNVSLYVVGMHNIIAMDYVEGTAVAECYCEMSNDTHTNTCMTNDVWEKVNGFLDDLSGLNTIVKDNGDIYLIDLA